MKAINIYTYIFNCLYIMTIKYIFMTYIIELESTGLSYSNISCKNRRFFAETIIL